MTNKVILIGSSPSIQSAALYIATANNNPVLFFYKNNNNIINYERIVGSGCEEGVYLRKGIEQLRRFEVECIESEKDEKVDNNNFIDNILHEQTSATPLLKIKNNTLFYKKETKRFFFMNKSSKCVIIEEEFKKEFEEILDEELNEELNGLFVLKGNRQAVVCVGEGCMMGMRVNWWLEGVN